MNQPSCREVQGPRVEHGGNETQATSATRCGSAAGTCCCCCRLSLPSARHAGIPYRRIGRLGHLLRAHTRKVAAVLQRQLQRQAGNARCTLNCACQTQTKAQRCCSVCCTASNKRADERVTETFRCRKTGPQDHIQTTSEWEAQNKGSAAHQVPASRRRWRWR